VWTGSGSQSQEAFSRMREWSTLTSSRLRASEPGDSITCSGLTVGLSLRMYDFPFPQVQAEYVALIRRFDGRCKTIGGRFRHFEALSQPGCKGKPGRNPRHSVQGGGLEAPRALRLPGRPASSSQIRKGHSVISPVQGAHLIPISEGGGISVMPVRDQDGFEASASVIALDGFRDRKLAIGSTLHQSLSTATESGSRKEQRPEYILSMGASVKAED